MKRGTDGMGPTMSLQDAVRTEDRAEIMRHIRSQLVDVTTTFGRDRPLVKWAAERGWVDVVDALLSTLPDAIIDPPRRGGIPSSCLQIAVSGGHVDLVRFLVEERGVTLTDNIDEMEETPFSGLAQVDADTRTTILEIVFSRAILPVHWGGWSDIVNPMTYPFAKRHAPSPLQCFTSYCEQVFNNDGEIDILLLREMWEDLVRSLHVPFAPEQLDEFRGAVRILALLSSVEAFRILLQRTPHSTQPFVMSDVHFPRGIRGYIMSLRLLDLPSTTGAFARSLLHEGYDVVTFDDNGRTPLMNAITQRNVGVARAILNHLHATMDRQGVISHLAVTDNDGRTARDYAEGYHLLRGLFHPPAGA